MRRGRLRVQQSGAWKRWRRRRARCRGRQARRVLISNRSRPAYQESRQIGACAQRVVNRTKVRQCARDEEACPRPGAYERQRVARLKRKQRHGARISTGQNQAARAAAARGKAYGIENQSKSVRRGRYR